MKEKRIEYLPAIQVISAFAVIALHTNSVFWTYSEEKYWLSANFLECLFYFAVPIFYMISGATLIGFIERYSIKEYLKRRILKAGIPFLGWSLIGLAYQTVLGRINIREVSLMGVLSGIMSTSYVQIFWFFMPLFCLYLSIPVFSAIDKKHQKKVFTYILILGFAANIAVPFFLSEFEIGLPWPILLEVINGNLLYAVAGYMLVHYPIGKTGRIVLYSLSVAGFLVHLIGTYVLSTAAGEVISTYKGYYSFACYLYSIGMFVFLQRLGMRIMKSKIAKCIQMLSKYTFPVYLMHYFVIDLLNICLKPDQTSLLYRLGAPFVIVAAIVVVTRFLRKIPYLNRLVP